jgi:hypothetical protein
MVVFSGDLDKAIAAFIIAKRRGLNGPQGDHVLYFLGP